MYLGGKKSIAIITAIKMKNDLDLDVRKYAIKTNRTVSDEGVFFVLQTSLTVRPLQLRGEERFPEFA